MRVTEVESGVITCVLSFGCTVPWFGMAITSGGTVASGFARLEVCSEFPLEVFGTIDEFGVGKFALADVPLIYFVAAGRSVIRTEDCVPLQANVSNIRRVADKETAMKISFITRNDPAYLCQCFQ